MSTALLSDADLVARAADGHEGSFTELYQRHVDAVHDHVARWTRDPALAADATQEAFVSLLRSLDTVRDGQAVLAWLMRTARNRAVDQLRRTGRERATAPIDDGGAQSALLTLVDEDRAGSPERAAEANEAAALLWEIAAGLDERTFAVLDLTVRHGLNGPELAQVLETTPANANVLVHRMRERLRSLFGATLLVRSGASECLDLGALRLTLTEPLDAAGARAVDAHADHCATCGERRRLAVAPMRAYAAFAEVRAPLEVHVAIEDAIRSHFGSAGPASPGRGRRFATVGGVVLLLLLGLVLLRPATPRDLPIALGVGVDLTRPSPSPLATPLQPLPTPEPSPSPEDTASPSPSPTPSPSPSPTPSPTPVTLAVTMDQPTATTFAAPSADRAVAGVAVVPVAATVTGADPALVTFRWHRAVDPATALLNGPSGEVRLPLDAPCTNSTVDLVVTATDTVSGATAAATRTLTLTHTCPPPLVVRILRPTDGTRVRTTGLDGRGRRAATVGVVGEADGDGRTYRYRWTSSLDPGATLLDGASGSVSLWADTCDPLTHVLTLTVTDTATGATGSASVTMIVEPDCPIP